MNGPEEARQGSITSTCRPDSDCRPGHLPTLFRVQITKGRPHRSVVLTQRWGISAG